MKPLMDKLIWAFTERGAEEPEKEAQLLNQILESLSIGILRDGLHTQEPLKPFLLKKYKV